MLIHPSSALFTSPSQVEVASRMLFAPRGQVVNGARSFAAFLTLANSEKWQTRLMNGRPVDLLSLAPTVVREANTLLMSCDKDETMAIRRRLVALIYGFDEHWPEIAKEFEESEGRLDLRGVLYHPLFSPSARIDRKEAGRKAFIALVPRWQRAFGYLSPTWQEIVRTRALGTHRVSAEGALLADPFAARPQEFLPVMGRLLVHLLLRPDGAQFSPEEMEQARWQLVSVTLDLMERVLEAGGDYYERGGDDFIKGLGEYGGHGEFFDAIHDVYHIAVIRTTRPKAFVSALKSRLSRYLPISPIAFFLELPTDVREFFKTWSNLRSLFEKTDLSEEDCSFLIAKGVASYLYFVYFIPLYNTILGRPSSPPSNSAQYGVHSLFEKFNGRPFEMPYQRAFEEVFLKGDSRLVPWLSKNSEWESLQLRLEELREFLELLVEAGRMSSVFAQWLSHYIGSLQSVDYEELSREFAKEFVGAYHMVIFGSGQPFTPPSQMQSYLWEAEAIHMLYNRRTLFRREVFENHIRQSEGKSPDAVITRMRQLVTGSTRSFLPPAPNP